MSSTTSTLQLACVGGSCVGPFDHAAGLRGSGLANTTQHKRVPGLDYVWQGPNRREVRLIRSAGSDMKSIAFITSFILIISASGLAQTHLASIRGRVTDAAGRAVSGAQID